MIGTEGGQEARGTLGTEGRESGPVKPSKGNNHTGAAAGPVLGTRRARQDETQPEIVGINELTCPTELKAQESNSGAIVGKSRVTLTRVGMQSVDGRLDSCHNAAKVPREREGDRACLHPAPFGLASHTLPYKAAGDSG